MFAVSFRIPFHLYGTIQYINGSAHTVAPPANAKGKQVTVFSTRYGRVNAEIVEVNRTSRPASTFEWGLVA